MENKTLRTWMQELASKDGKYTGGSAASSVAAISVSLAQFIFELQAGKKRYEEQEELIQAGIKKAASLQNDLLELIEIDASAFEPVLPLYRLPQKTADEKAIREEKLNAGLAGASQPPYEMMQKIAETVDLYEQLEGLNLAGSLKVDVVIGLDIAIAALKSSKNSSMINIIGITDDELKKELTEKVERFYEETLEKAKEIKKRTESFID